MSKSKSSSTTSRPIHPAYVPTFAPLGAELSAWAYLTVPRPAAGGGGGNGNADDNENSTKQQQQQQQQQVLPNLVTAHSTALRIYSLDPATGRLILASTYDDLAGSIVSLDVVVGGAGEDGSGGSAASDNGNGGGGGGPMYDALLLGFAGEPRLSVVYPPTVLSSSSGGGAGSSQNGNSSWSGILTASSIVDLTPALIDACRGGRGPTEVDLVCCVGGSGSPGTTTTAASAGAGAGSGGSTTIPTTTAAAILGGGVAVAAFDLARSPRPSSSSSSDAAATTTKKNTSGGWWRTATEPYILPLSTLSTALNPEPTSSSGAAAATGKGGKRYAATGLTNAPKIGHGFGDILDCQYLRGYTEPVLLLLHSNPNRLGGRAWPGRLATPSNAGGTRHPLTLTAISISVTQRRSVVLWSLCDAMPSDSTKLVAHPVDGVLVVGANEIVYVDGGGRIRCGVASNGFARATCPSSLVSAKVDNASSATSASTAEAIVAANPSPLPLLSFALDGCRISFVSDDVAALCSRGGTVFSLEIHRGVEFSAGSGRVAQSLSLSHMNCRLGGIGMVSSLSALPLATLGGKSIGGSSFDDLAAKVGGIDETGKKHQDGTKLGVLFAGSRLGDSTLLFYGMRERVTLIEPDAEGDDEKAGAGGKRKRDQKDQKEAGGPDQKRGAVKDESSTAANDAAAVTDDEDAYRMEEEALYAPPEEGELEGWGGENVAVIAKDDDLTKKSSKASPLAGGIRPTIDALSVFDSPAPRAIDSLTGLGPLGAGTIGPTSAAGAGGRGASSTSVHPCGWGTSGGLAVLTVPGMNASSSENGGSGTMVTEADCRDISTIFSLQECGLVLLGREAGGTVVMRMSKPQGTKMVSSPMSPQSSSTAAVGALSIESAKKMKVGDLREELRKRNLDIEGLKEVLQDRLIAAIEKEEQESNATPKIKVKTEEIDDNDQSDSKDTGFVEVDMDELTGEAVGDLYDAQAMEVDDEDVSTLITGDDATVASILKSTKLLQATEWSPANAVRDNYISLLVASGTRYFLVILFVSTSGTVGLVETIEIRPPSTPQVATDESIQLISSTPFAKQGLEGDDSQLELGLVWSNGFGTLAVLRNDGDFHLSSVTLDGTNEDSNAMKEKDNEEEEDDEVERYYASNLIISLDIFEASSNLFKGSLASSGEEAKVSDGAGDDQRASESYGAGLSSNDFDADDFELYGSAIGVDTKGRAESSTSDTTAAGGNDASRTIAPTRINPMGGSADREGPSTTFLAICRQSGSLEIHDIAKVDFACGLNDSSLVWQSSGCGIGSPVLVQGALKPPRTPRMHSSRTVEMRLFFAGPSKLDSATSSSGDVLGQIRSFCLLVETDLGDIHLYAASDRGSAIDFTRIPTGMVGRPSKDQARHTLKLRRRKIIITPSPEESEQYRPNRLHRFSSISNQSGIFARSARPFWVVSERGAPAVVQHRARHVAPAGGKDVPVAGFCDRIALPEKGGVQRNGFLTLHERIGRVGSQRITVFDGLSDIFAPLGLFPGGGLCVQKVPFGVTVRQIQFIDDASVSSAARPLYALLISREIEEDQGLLDDDGLSPEERQKIKDEKEKEKTLRQVEADLGGFDVEQEWVEEIERDDYFEIDSTLGRAPPLPKRVFEVWLVDAASGWNVIDSYQLKETEHGASMEVMSLSELVPDTRTSSASSNQDDFDNDLFIVVGTGIIDKDGEDVQAKGRILLFNVSRNTDEEIEKGEPQAEMTFIYDKDIALGPVTSLSCLTSEGKNRLVVGAGAEITIEQWTGAKLVQVGFFHVNMQVQRINLFKTFFLLSDAYDSLHFLVWRESDKSLTLLAKDYEPVVLYAVGLMSRGGAMSFVCHDDRENLQFLQYAPNDVAARGGNKLVCRADFHLGTQTTSLQSHFCRSSLLINSATPTSTLAALKQQDPLFGRIDDDQRFAVHFGSTDGGLASLIPLSEQAYWRLTALQSVMSNALDSNCALSYKAWRLYRRSARRGGCRSNDRVKGVIDGELVAKFADLSLAEQEDLASAIGSTVELIMDNILDIRCCGMVI